MESILTLTVNPSIDKSCELDHVIPERKLRCSQPIFEPGGGGLNVARAIKKLGGESEALYFCGGPPGEILNHFLEKEGINHQPVKIQNWTRENLVVYETATRQQYRFGMPGPEIMGNEYNKILDCLENRKHRPSYLVASGSLSPGMPIDFYGRVSRIARKTDTRLIVDTSGEALTAALEEGGVYLIKPNIGEFKDIAAKHGEIEEDEVISTARAFIDQKKVSVLVISLGSAGSMLVTKDGCVNMRAPAVSIKSKVGAGDSMVAGITLALARGKTLEDAIRFGIAAGAAAVMTPGTELCRKEDAERLYEKMKMDVPQDKS
jgi:6-phosphofructokinase 2